MSYSTVVAMTNSGSLTSRVAAAAAAEGYEGDARSWAQQNIMKIASQDPAWQSGWEYAMNTMTVNFNPDIGIRDDVITDAMILNEVQVALAAPA